MVQNEFTNTEGRIALQGQIFNNGIININDDSRVRDVRAEKEMKILRTLHQSVEINRKDRNPERVPGTCEWFTADPRFKQWKANKSSMLWVSADPGCGKSVLAKHLVDNVLQSTDSRTTCYFFFKDDFEGQGSVTTALCCILSQLFTIKPALLSDTIIKEFDIAGDGFAGSFSVLWCALLTAAKNAGEIICILDAIDECKESDWSLLKRELQTIYSKGGDFSSTSPDPRTNSSQEFQQTEYNVKFLLTSRPYREIRHSFQPLITQGPESLFIHLSGESEEEIAKISLEIDLFIEAKIRHIGDAIKLTKEEQTLLSEKLKCVPNKTYIWVYLTLDLIENDINTNINLNRSKILEVTSRLPETVDDAYERILSKSYDPEMTKTLLHIVVAAARPLHLQEINIALALALKDTHQSYATIDYKTDERLKLDVRDLCGLFIIVAESKVYLLHQTAKEFLVRSDTKTRKVKGFDRNFKWKESLQLRDGHQTLTSICIRHLLFEEFGSNPLTQDVQRLEYIKKYIFLDYSARYWVTHFKDSKIELEAYELPRIMRLCDTDSKSCLTWLRIYWASTNTSFPDGFTSLMVASYFGLAAIVKLLLRLKPKINYRDSTYMRSALSWAAENGSDVIVRQLLKGNNWKGIPLLFAGGAEVNSRDKYNRTPLVYAIWRRQTSIVARLLKAGARVDLEDDVGGTPLSYAICSGHDGILDRILKSGTKIESRDTLGRKLLFSAVGKGRGDVVKMLLEVGEVDVDVENDYGDTPLLLAIGSGNIEVVRVLLENGAGVEVKGAGDSTPLCVAVSRSDEAIIRLLLERSVSMEAKGSLGNTPLSLAIGKYWSEAVVRLLVERGADIESKNDFHITPLSIAAMNGREAIVRLLVEKGADIESKDNDGRTPLSFAAINGRDATVGLLVEKGADIESKDNDGRTPLSFAVINGRDATVGLLVERGADIESKSNNGRTPLSFAAINWRDATVRLLEKGADIASKSNDGRTPLSFAVENNLDIKVARLLIEKGADIESKSSDGRTPLSFAAENNLDIKVARLLIEKGADIESKSNDGRTPLSFAAINGREAIVRLLVEKGADIESKSNDSRTPLSFAVANSWGIELAQLLIEKGADIESKSNDGRTPLLFARSHEDMASLLTGGNAEDITL
ncbi:hypothetical protein TWF694_000301 [Orbilia ellipsospora]|uniref:Ankyrin repeat protein n=1 Tax=Orbilia ellipsospora TaxID=2528407 RepID=A0AAV9XN73_9PEZI